MPPIFFAVSAGGSSARWTPANFTGVRTYWDPSVSAVASGGAYVSVEDLIGTNDLAQATAGLRPLVSAADPAFNGKNVARMTGTQWMQSIANVGAMTATSFSVFLVFSLASLASPNSVFDNSNGVSPFARVYSQSGGALSVMNSGSYISPYLLNTSPHSVVWVANAATSSFLIYVDGVLVASPSPVTVADPWTAASAFIGRDHGPFAGFNGKFAAGGIVNGVIPPSEVALFTAFSQTKFGTP